MKLNGAVIKEQGVTFAIVVVKRQILQSQHEANTIMGSSKRIFGNIPIILMAQNQKDIPSYYGRKDIVRFLSKVPFSAIPWKQYTLN